MSRKIAQVSSNFGPRGGDGYDRPGPSRMDRFDAGYYWGLLPVVTIGMIMNNTNQWTFKFNRCWNFKFCFKHCLCIVQSERISGNKSFQCTVVLVTAWTIHSSNVFFWCAYGLSDDLAKVNSWQMFISSFHKVALIHWISCLRTDPSSYYNYTKYNFQTISPLQFSWAWF